MSPDIKDFTTTQEYVIDGDEAVLSVVDIPASVTLYTFEADPEKSFSSNLSSYLWKDMYLDPIAAPEKATILSFRAGSDIRLANWDDKPTRSIILAAVSQAGVSGDLTLDQFNAMLGRTHILEALQLDGYRHHKALYVFAPSLLSLTFVKPPRSTAPKTSYDVLQDGLEFD